jgi:hypothetical protein
LRFPSDGLTAPTNTFTRPAGVPKCAPDFTFWASEKSCDDWLQDQ